MAETTVRSIITKMLVASCIGDRFHPLESAPIPIGLAKNRKPPPSHQIVTRMGCVQSCFKVVLRADLPALPQISG